MSYDNIKQALIMKINSMKLTEVKKLYSLIKETENSQDDFKEWNEIDEGHKIEITKGLSDLANGKKKDAFIFLMDIKEKYRINA